MHFMNDKMTETASTFDFAPILEEVNRLESLLLQCRSVFPSLTKKMIGHREFPTAPYYMRRGYKAQIQLEDPITEKFIERNRTLGKWINENALIRLYGIMFYRGFLDKIDQSLMGWREVDLTRRMRDIFTKSRLNYQPNDAKNIRLREEVIKHFRLKKEDFPEGEIPTPIDAVVVKLFNGCREYIKAKYAAHNTSLKPTP